MSIGAMISYSKHDVDTALALRDRLSRAGVRVWMDRTDIVPGSDWQKCIETAIRDCAVMLVLLSTSSLSSREVEAEWSLALRLEKQLLPLLLESVELPFRLANYQFLRVDREKPEEAAEQLAKLLPQSSEPPTRLVTDSEAYDFMKAEPSRYAEIVLWLEDESLEMDARRRVVVDRAAFGSVKSLLDRLYMEHLSDYVAPYSYGEEWILHGPWVVAPSAWLKRPWTRLQDVDLTWISRTTLADIGLEAGWQHWSVTSGRGNRRLKDMGLFGVLGSNPVLMNALAAHPKSSHYLLHCQDLFERQSVRAAKLNSRPIERVFVAYGFRDLAGKVFIETSQAAESNELLKKHWAIASRLA